jgi:hypothetical protein
MRTLLGILASPPRLKKYQVVKHKNCTRVGDWTVEERESDIYRIAQVGACTDIQTRCRNEHVDSQECVHYIQRPQLQKSRKDE